MAKSSFEGFPKPVPSGGKTNFGNVIPAHVLAPDKFSGAAYINADGTMPNNAGDVAAISSHSGGGGTIHVVPATGYTDGSDDASVITDANFIDGNIKSGVDIFGLAGSYAAVNYATGVSNGSLAGSFSVSGLAFSPTSVFIWQRNHSGTGIFHSYLQITHKNRKMAYGGSSDIYHWLYGCDNGSYSLDGGTEALTWAADGFTIITIGAANGDYVWMAIDGT